MVYTTPFLCRLCILSQLKAFGGELVRFESGFSAWILLLRIVLEFFADTVFIHNSCLGADHIIGCGKGCGIGTKEALRVLTFSVYHVTTSNKSEFI